MFNRFDRCAKRRAAPYNKTGATLSSAIALFCCLTPEIVEAQTKEGGSAQTKQDEIVVTAQRREESLQQVPISVTAIGGEQIEQLRFQDATQIVQQIPNMNAVTTYGNSAPLFSVRGMSNSDFSPSSNTPVPLYADDILINNITGQGFALFDLERVEALKGPQGTLFGYNSSAGTIHFISRKPTDIFEGSGSISFASRDEQALNMALGGPVVGDSVRGRLAFFSRKDDGDFVNINNGKRIGKDQRWAVRGMLDIDLSPNAGVLFKAQYGKSDGDPAIRHTEQAVNNFTGEVLGGRYQIRQELGEFEEVESAEISSRFHLDLDAARLELISGYLKIDSGLSTNLFDGTQVGLLNLGYGAPVTTPFYGPQGFSSGSKQFSQEARLTSQFDGPFSFILGAFYLHENLDGRNWFLGGDDAGAFGYFGNDPSVFLMLNEYNQELSSSALFAQGDYELTPELRATLGGRVSWDKRSLDLTFANYDGATTYANARTIDPFDVTLADVTDLSGLETTQQDLSWTNWSGRFAIDYQPNSDTLLYASLSRGVKSGAFNTVAFIDLSEANSVAPETVVAYETGVKLDLADRRVQLNLAGFYYDVDNYHQKVVDELGREFLVGADKVKFYGFELEARARPTESLTTQLAVGWQKGTYTDFVEPTPLGPVDRSGNIVPGTGAFTISGIARLDLPVSGVLTLAPQVDFNFTQGSFYSPANTVKAAQLTPTSKTDDFFNLNLRLSLSDVNNRHGITLFVQNALGQYRALRRNPVGFLDNSLTSYSPRRAFGVMLNGKL